MEALLIVSQYTRQNRNVLIIVPSPTVNDWLIDLIRKFDIRPYILDNEERIVSENYFISLEKFKGGVVLTTYDYILSNSDRFKNIDWELCILDEAHRFRSYKIKENKTAETIISIIPNAKKILLSATPIQKNEDDIFGLINFIDEKEFLGTGGGLYFIKDIINSTIFLTNCDVLIDYDYSKILEHHRKSNNIATVICVEKNENLSYGVLELDKDGNILEIKEKPNLSFVINTGIYIIEPEFLEYIPENTFIHITDIIEKCIKNGKSIGTYVLEEENWLDMGQFDELEKMKERLEI